MPHSGEKTRGGPPRCLTSPGLGLVDGKRKTEKQQEGPGWLWGVLEKRGEAGSEDMMQEAGGWSSQIGQGHA